ncbi:hypothetical protein BJ138DRAFT_1105935 [Hygrophoropsis aurantiaca]|uniref:Uncharacterized protein n=1 Tax=Hygrophoropsis aurantiaca TaxID=72124 RepID=A0ACB7ZWS6_9AGAM|nr:hypothetical protein BJ138DRAFT_1105935 [Hygrophoropsis aurantiaca]
MDQVGVPDTNQYYPNHSDTIFTGLQPVSTSNSNPAKCRASPLSSTLAEGLRVTQKVKVSDGGSGGRVRAGDFDKIYQSILMLAISHYRCMLLTMNPYPSAMQAQQWAGEAWANACRSKGVLIEFDEDSLKLIRARESNIRGNFKKTARELLKAEFDPTTPAARRENRKLVSMLTTQINMTYKDPIARKGPYQHPIIQKIINKNLYNKKTAEGVTLPGYFKESETGGFPFALIVTVVTAIQAAIEEYSTGEQKDALFAAEKYSHIFATQFGSLEVFHQGTAHADLLPKICRQMLKAARCFANVPEESAAPTIAKFSTADFASAVQDWANNDLPADEDVARSEADMDEEGDDEGRQLELQ